MSDYPASFDETELTMFPSKFVPGGGWGTHAPVSALLQPYDHDVHYVAYTEETATRLRKDLPHGPLSFGVMVYDLDAHGATKATDADFDALVTAGRALAHPPNWISKSKNGAHALYLVSEITDSGVYEATRQKLGETVAPIAGGTPYTLDTTTVDWTRMLRSPRTQRLDLADAGGVVVETRTDLREARIEIIHGDVLDIAPWKTEPKKREAAAGGVRRANVVMPVGVRDRLAKRWLDTQLGAVSGDGGHGRTFGVCCALFSRFGLTYDEALPLIEEWNQRCAPPWSQREIEHKLADAERRVRVETDDE